jgi:hypothetical protein
MTRRQQCIPHPLRSHRRGQLRRLQPPGRPHPHRQRRQHRRSLGCQHRPRTPLPRRSCRVRLFRGLESPGRPHPHRQRRQHRQSLADAGCAAGSSAAEDAAGSADFYSGGEGALWDWGVTVALTPGPSPCRGAGWVRGIGRAGRGESCRWRWRGFGAVALSMAKGGSCGTRQQTLTPSSPSAHNTIRRTSAISGGGGGVPPTGLAPSTGRGW